LHANGEEERSAGDTVAGEDDVHVIVVDDNSSNVSVLSVRLGWSDRFVSHNSSWLSADIKEGCARRLGWGGVLSLPPPERVYKAALWKRSAHFSPSHSYVQEAQGY